MNVKAGEFTRIDWIRQVIIVLMRGPKARVVFMRMEKDLELLARMYLNGKLRPPIGTYGRTLDQFAEAHGFQRRLIEDIA